MTTWKNVLKVFVCCLGALMAVLLLVSAYIWAMETDMEIKSLQKDMEIMKAAQRPLVKLQGKYVNVFTSEKEVVIETRERGKP